MTLSKPLFYFGIFVLFFYFQSSSAQISVAKIFSDNMVLQQNAEVSIWGWASPGDSVSVTGSWNNETKKVVTRIDSKWLAKLNTPAAKTDGTSYSVKIEGTNTVTLSNVLVGEVWLLSGQSNMEMQLQGWTGSPIEGSTQAIATANFPNIRFITINKKSASAPQQDIVNNNSFWVECSPATSRYFSAVGFFFGRELHQKLNIPIGLVNSSWGGSSCETWAEESSLDFVSDYANNGPWNSTKIDDNQTATVLYNGMIAPIIPFNFAGVCWYQGETNAGRPAQLTELFPAMIEGWRNVFQKENLPFYFVQLAPYGGYSNGSLPTFWEAQAYALNLHHTEMAETLDAGNEVDIHPARKEPIAYRLAQKALANVYGNTLLVNAGPRYDSLKIETNRIRLYFSHTGTGLKTDGGNLRQFEIAGSSNIFYQAEAEIEGNEIVVSSNFVAEPKNVRYAWNKNANASLFNNEDFPAPPFRTNPASYIQAVKSKLLINSELIKEGEKIQLKWTTIGANVVKLNLENKSPSGAVEIFPDTTTTYSLLASNGKEEIITSKKVYVIPKELSSWAKNKNVEASSNRFNYNAEFAVDEKINTKWSSNSSNNEWISIDLGETIPVNLVILHWAPDYGKAYEIQISDDKQNWTTIFTELSGNGGLDFIPDLEGTGRYVRMKGISRSNSRGYDLTEFEVYSTEFRKTGTLVDKDGKIMRGTPMVLGKNQTASVQFASDVKNWNTIKNNGFNTIRVCWVDPWYKDHGYDNWSVSEVLPHFDNCVQNATESGMNIIINYHNVGAQQNYDSEYTFELEKEFWDSIAPRYKNNDLVFYEIANEPTFATNDYLKPVFKQNLLKIYNNIKNVAPERQILLFSFNHITPDFLNVVEDYKNEINWEHTSVAYHMYGSTESNPVKILMAYHRVICTEWNYDHVSKREGFEYIKQVDGFKENSQTMEILGSGWIDWRDWSDTTLNELLDTLIIDARLKNYWWGEPVLELKTEGVKISPVKTSLKTGNEKNLTAYVFPALAENQNISWSSSNNEYVTVNENGLITAVATQSKLAIITAKSDDGNFTASCEVTIIPPEKKGAYPNGVPHKIPGTINPTHYDLGGEGIGYHDLNPANNGDGIRQDQGVETEYRLETGTIGGIQNGEWLEYTIDIEEDGNYTVAILFAAIGQFGKFHIEIDEEDISGQIYVIPSGNNNIFRPTTLENILLLKGVRIMRIHFDYAFYNMGTISIYKTNTTSSDLTADVNSIKIFPNPANNKLYISGYQYVQKYSIQNINGQVIEMGNFVNNPDIDITHLPQGNYLISLTGKDFCLTEKVIKL